MKRLTTAAALALALTRSASAQELNFATTSSARPNIVGVRTGVDHALVAEVGYRRVLLWRDRQLFVGGDVALPWAGVDLGDYRLRATVGLPVLGSQHWKLAAWLSPTLRGTENAMSRMTGLGADLRLTGGFYARRWFAATEVGLDWVATTYVAVSDEYRTVAYAGAKDGWYSLTGGTGYVGVIGGVSFSSFDVVVRAGHPRTIELAEQSVPLYLTVGVNLTLPR